MNTVIKDTFGEGDAVAYKVDDHLMNKVLASLARNNTFCPNITKCYLQKDVDRKVFDRDTKKNVKVKRDVLKVSFTDGTWVEVARNPDDADDIMTAILYALAKRMFGTYTDGGYVSGTGFMKRIKDIASGIVTPEKETAEKNARIKAKEDADKKEHEEAVNRKIKNPSIGLRMKNLEDKFEKLVDILSKK